MNKKITIILNSLKFQSFSFLKYAFFKKKRKRIKRYATDYFYNLPCIDFDNWAREIDINLFNEMQKFQAHFQDYETNFNFTYLGGARGLDQYGALYFLTRLIKPQNILETGVANGFSSYSFLSAIEKNNFGRLVSNDLPPLDIEKKNWKYIGQMVPKKFHTLWTLHLGSDRKNLNSICKESTFDLAHFDSDKLSSGKMFCINTLLRHNKTSPIILIDNCADDFFWKNLIIKSYKKVVFEQNTKRFGILIHKDDITNFQL